MSDAGAEWAARVEAQHVVNVARQCRKIDPAPFGQVSGGQRAGDRVRQLPQLKRAAEFRFIAIGEARLYDRPVPGREPLNGGVAIHSFHHHQPFDVVAVRAAAETVEMIIVDLQAWRVVGMEGAVDLAVTERLANQVGERNL